MPGAGPTAGLKYQTPTLSGFTTDDGEFQYRAGEAITFLVGGLVLGSVKATSRLNLAQLANRVAGKIDKLHDPSITNLGRFIHTLDEDGDIEKGVVCIAEDDDGAVGYMRGRRLERAAMGRIPSAYVRPRARRFCARILPRARFSR